MFGSYLPRFALLYHSIKRIILNKYSISINLEKNTRLKHLKRNGTTYKLTILQRKSVVATFRLLTGQDCLKKNLLFIIRKTLKGRK